ncbi:MAG TPA: hypothetical protein VH165_05720 [Kofleriaceae bacterium]|jgi:hypothetical protein|nr:hypothetical protein [Kofleriaceae bacterium]
MFGRAQGQLAAAAWLLGLASCTDPPGQTSLRPDGPPEVLAVLASDDTTGSGIAEIATFCKLDDDKRPGLVPSNPNGPDQVCPSDPSAGADEVTDVVPINWYIRIQFDELLDGDKVEDLIPIVDSAGDPTGTYRGTLVHSQPVSLSCGGTAISYDGYYNPSGNSLTWPLGPSLIVIPDDTAAVATGTECQVSIASDVVDKDGNRVPDAQVGPYTFKIAPLVIVATSPQAADPMNPSPIIPTISAGSPLIVTFNAPIDATSLTASELTVLEVASCDAADGTPHTAVIEPSPIGRDSITIRDRDAAAGDDWLRGKIYRISSNADADIKDVAGGVGALSGDSALAVCFQIGA